MSITYEPACQLLGNLPEHPEHPFCSYEVVPVEDEAGTFNIEWYVSVDRLLSVCVDRDGVVCWAALVDGEDPRGSLKYTGGPFPDTLRYWVERIYK